MSTIVTRAGKGSALTNNEVDANFTNLNTDKIQVTGAPVNGYTILWDSGTSTWIPGIYGDASGPASATANALARFDSTSGKLLKNSAVTLDDSGNMSGVTLVTPALGTPTAGNFSSGTFTWPTFNQDTTGNAANVTGVVAIANGGTNASTISGAQTNLQVDPAGTAVAMSIALG